ncbi:MAG: ATP-dependent 6-phosphofructokinase [Phototrophicales bacterium]|nr:MAG: ATP-dependent 6-phosphofructokinase [Phototrophicales bacterium]
MNILAVVSGGDAPGINAALFHLSRLVESNDDVLYGASGGFLGLLNEQIVELSPTLLMPTIGSGGSYLPSSREPVLNGVSRRAKIKSILEKYAIDGIVLFGGDGTMRHVLPIVSVMAVPCIGIPTTIDNDVPGTDETLGFDSACNYAISAIDGILATAHGLPGRGFAVETLGGRSGILALQIARAVGAHAVLLPEYDFDEQWLVDRLRQALDKFQHALLVYGEGIASSRTLIDTLHSNHHLRLRDTRLGHAQRGSRPSYRDRWLANEMMDLVYQAFADGIQYGVVVIHDGRLRLSETDIAHLPPKMPDRNRYERINDLHSS